jgi:hypothetical protein
VLEAALEFTGGAEDIDETEAVATDGIVASCILLSVSDEEAAADVLDIEGRKANGDAIVIEGFFAEIYPLEIGVVDFDASGGLCGTTYEIMLAPSLEIEWGS